MKVRMTVAVSGTRNGQPWPPRGDVLEVGDFEGAELCASGMAVPVVDDKTEKAVPPPAEVRSKTAGRTRPAGKVG